MEDPNLVMARKVAQAVAARGGRTFFVGGYVRDNLMGIANKDIDIEVHGIPADQLRDILDSLGESTLVGASFGILGLKHYDLDIAMPRSEKALGRGHKDFLVSVDPFIGYEKAALRRDFTINAFMQDVLTGEVLDFFGGAEDLKNGVIRHINNDTFAEDPLRVLRGAQFAARFGFRVAGETKAVSAQMDLTALSAERVTGELEKALLKADRPSVFFEILRGIGQLDFWFPELKALTDTPQNPVYHPEGSVWNHTMLVLDAAARVRANASKPLWFMLSALCHDFGKAKCTRMHEGRWIAWGHEKEGVEIVDTFLTRLTGETELHKYVLNMVECHMEPNTIAGQTSRDKAFMKMFDRSCCPDDLLLLARCDAMGKAGDGISESEREAAYENTRKILQSKLEIYRELIRRPCVMGRDLVAAGFKPGPSFSRALEYAHKLRLAGLDKEEQLRQTLAFLRKES